MTKPMRRIMVIGPGGAGKSTLSKALAAKLDLPLIHLDKHYWQPGWVPMTEDHWPAAVEELAARETWVMDGNFAATFDIRMPRTDLVVFLDFGRWASLWGAFTRVLKQSGQVRSDMAPGCPEKFDAAFFVWLWNFPRDTRPTLTDALERYPQVPVVRLTSRRAIQRWLAAIT